MQRDDFGASAWTHITTCSCCTRLVHSWPEREVSQSVIDASGWANGGVRGIVAGDVIRTLTARTMAKQLSKVVGNRHITIPDALSTRAGCEDHRCVRGRNQGLQGENKGSIDAPFCSLNGAGLLAFGRHLHHHFSSESGSCGGQFAATSLHPCTHSAARKMQVWTGAGIRPPACEVLEQIARAVDPRAVVWKGLELPVEDQGSRCWEHHSATPSLSQLIWSGSRRNTECCWTESQKCRMCNLRG